MSCFQICTILYSFWDVHLALNGDLGCCFGSVVVKPPLISSSFVGWRLWVQVQQGMLFRFKQHRAMCCMKWHYSNVYWQCVTTGCSTSLKERKEGVFSCHASLMLVSYVGWIVTIVRLSRFVAQLPLTHVGHASLDCCVLLVGLVG